MSLATREQPLRDRRPVRDDQPPASGRTYTPPAVEVLGTVRSLTSKPRPGVQPIVMITGGGGIPGG